MGQVIRITSGVTRIGDTFPQMGSNSADTLDPLVREYCRARRARGELTPRTAQTAQYTLGLLAASYGRRPLDKFGPKAIDRWLESIGDRAPSTRREYLSRVKVFCRWLVARKAIKTDPTTHVERIRQPRRTPVTLTPQQVARLFIGLPDLRARAIVWLMVGCGARCVEVSRLRVEDYDPAGRTILLVGKGMHERQIPVPREVCVALNAYLDEAGTSSGPLIRSTIDPARGLAAKTLSTYLREWMTAAGVKVRARDGRSAHGLRRTAGSDVMDRVGDIRVVQEMLGHLDVQTTANYYLRRVSEAKLRDAMEGRPYDGVEVLIA